MKRIILPVITILAAFSFSNAQVKKIYRGNFDTARLDALGKMETSAWRSVAKTEFLKKDGTVSLLVTETTERIPFRLRVLTVMKQGDVETDKELIVVGENVYVRENGVWRAESSGETSGSDGLEYSSCRQYTEEEVVVNGAKIRKLGVSEIFNDSSKGFMFQNYSIWYDKEGRFLRQQRVKGLLDPKIEESREVTTYEHNVPDLKIEAPIK